MTAVWVVWTDRGGPLRVVADPASGKIGAPMGIEWTYIRGRYPRWEGVCGGKEKGCLFHEMAIHSTWYITRFEIAAGARASSARG